jgi:hypothetical protein
LNLIDGTKDYSGELAEADDDFVERDGSSAGEEEEESDPERRSDDGAKKASHWRYSLQDEGKKLGGDRRMMPIAIGFGGDSELL